MVAAVADVLLGGGMVIVAELAAQLAECVELPLAPRGDHLVDLRRAPDGRHIRSSRRGGEDRLLSVAADSH
eukprot:4219181-Lingulodinium_polyedra.AAC.1